MTTNTPRPSPRWSWPFWLGAMLFAAAIAKTPISGLDIWWHLRSGEALATRPGWLATNTWSWSGGATPWPYKDIGADLLLYFSHTILGDAALSLWPGLAVLGIAAAFYAVPVTAHFARNQHTSGHQQTRRADVWRWLLPLVVLAAVVAASQHRLHARPMLLSHVAFAWLLVWLPQLWPRRAAGQSLAGQSLASQSRPWRGLVRVILSICALMWLWSWSHRGVLIGVASLWAWTAAIAVNSVFSRKIAPSIRPRGLAALAASVASSVVLLLTPNGTAVITTVIAALGRSDYVGAVDEWAILSPWTLLREHGSWLLLVVWAVLTTVARLRGWRRLSATAKREVGPPLAMTSLALGLSVVAFGASRWIPYAAMAAAHAVLLWWSLTTDAMTPLPRPRPASIRVAAVSIVLCLIWVSARSGTALPGTRAAGRYPTAALDFAMTHGLPAQVVNAYDFGGYLLWHGRPRWRSEIDGRADMVFSPALFLDVLSSHLDGRSFQARRRLDDASWVLAPNRPQERRFAFLQRDPSWCLVFWSTPAVIWLKRDVHPALCKRLAFRTFTTSAFDVVAYRAGRSHDPTRIARAITELARMQKQAPQDPRPAIAAVVLQHAIGDLTRRDHLLSKVVRDHGDNPAVLALLRRLAR